MGPRHVSFLVIWATSLVPAAWLAAVGVFVLRARLLLGRWPEPYAPDPKDLGFTLHHAAIVGGIPLMFAAVLGVIGLTVVTRPQWGRHWVPSFVAVASLVAAICVARLDPARLFTWLAD